MGVIYIGDRETGKTHLAMELGNPNYHYVKVTYPDYNTLKAKVLYDEVNQKTQPTEANQPIYNEHLEIEVELPVGKKEIFLDWVDTPGEIWRKSWQNEHSQEWNTFLDNLKQSEGILVVLPPYREIIKKNLANPEDFITRQQWCNRFNRWVAFFKQDCPKIRHLILCLNKADLFCDNLKQEAQKLSYIPHNSPMNWQQKDKYISGRYFKPIEREILQLNQSIRGLSVRCFITSIHNRELLELPWIYLGGYLA